MPSPVEGSESHCDLTLSICGELSPMGSPRKWELPPPFLDL